MSGICKPSKKRMSFGVVIKEEKRKNVEWKRNIPFDINFCTDANHLWQCDDLSNPHTIPDVVSLLVRMFWSIVVHLCVWHQ